MDAISALWFTSVVGAVGFTATGFFLARSRMPDSDARPAAQPVTPAAASVPAPAAASVPVAASIPPASTPPASTPLASASPASLPPASAPPASLPPASIPPSSVPSLASIRAAAAVPASDPPDALTDATTPSTAPRRDPRREDSDTGVGGNDTDVLHRSGSEAPKRRASALPPPGGASNGSATTAELERQLQALRLELRAEVVARDKVEMRAKDLATRLSSMAEREAAHKRSSVAPPAAAAAAPEPRKSVSVRAPGLFAEIDQLKSEIARLTAENDSLRAAALGAPAPRRTSAARTDLIVPEVLKRMVDRIARLQNVRAAAVAESSGLVLAGSGELAEALSAFGAYITDAATRSDRLLPLKDTTEVTVCDSNGLLFSTRVIGMPESEVSLVTLVQGDAPTLQIRNIVAHTPGLDAYSLNAR